MTGRFVTKLFAHLFPRETQEEEIDATPSSGCVFCDLEITDEHPCELKK